jgi:glycosyltransferase involved in cell wall biosynthesis
MRIAYVAYWNAFVLDGVARKIGTQAAHWRRAGHDVEIFVLSPAGDAARQQWHARAHTFSSIAGRPAAAVSLLRDLAGFRPDVVYLRYDLLPPPLHVVMRRHPTVVELNSDEQREYAFRRPVAARLSHLYGRWNWQHLFRRAAGIVSVSNELLALVAGFGRPTTAIGNGVELDGIDPLPAEAEGPPRLVFSGTPGQPWHGVDKIVDLAARRPDLEVTLLGTGPDDRFPPNVQAHGYLDRASYVPLLAGADAGFGSAALHRNGMAEASPLKVREYLAYGLPVIVPYTDTDLRGLDAWWLLDLPNAESNLVDAADRIARFAREARGRRVPRDAVADRIGAAAKESARLDFLADCIAP